MDIPLNGAPENWFTPRELQLIDESVRHQNKLGHGINRHPGIAAMALLAVEAAHAGFPRCLVYGASGSRQSIAGEEVQASGQPAARQPAGQEIPPARRGERYAQKCNCNPGFPGQAMDGDPK